MTQPPRALLFTFLFLVFGLFSYGYVENSDAEVELQTARAIAVRGSTALSAEHADASAAEVAICRLKANVVRGQDGAYYTWFGVGHIAALLPFWMIGRGLASVFPAVEREQLDWWRHDLGEDMGRAIGEDFFVRLVVSFHSPLFAALTGVVLLMLLGHLGFGTRSRVLAVLCAMFATQLAPGSRENMSDVTAGFVLLFALERAIAWHVSGGRGKLVLAGALAGFAVLCRVTHLVPVAALASWVLWRSRHDKRFEPLCFVLGGLPFAAFLLWFNNARFGSPLKTGYHELTGYWSFPFFYGFVLLVLSAGKGALWFSPLLWLAPAGLRRLGSGRRPEVLLFAAFFVGPWLLNSFASGWHSSQAWGCRYLTVGAVLLVAVASAAILDSVEQPRTFWFLAGLGVLINLGGWLAPYHGFYELALHEAAKQWPNVPSGDLIHYIAVDPRYSPLFGHWVYAWRDLTGTLPVRPSWTADTGFGHLWPIGLTQRLGSFWPLVIAAFGVLIAAVTGRRLFATSSRPPEA